MSSLLTAQTSPFRRGEVDRWLGREYDPFEGPLCSFEEAILWFAYRNNAKVRATPSLFSLREWPDKITKALLLLSRDLARERQTINSFASFAMRPLVEVAFYRRVWALKTEEAMIGRTEALPPIDENLMRQIEWVEGIRRAGPIVRTFRHFIDAVRDLLGP
jgi:hypothetical protein